MRDTAAHYEKWNPSRRSQRFLLVSNLEPAGRIREDERGLCSAAPFLNSLGCRMAGRGGGRPWRSLTATSTGRGQEGGRAGYSSDTLTTPRLARGGGTAEGPGNAPRPESAGAWVFLSQVKSHQSRNPQPLMSYLALSHVARLQQGVAARHANTASWRARLYLWRTPRCALPGPFQAAGPVMGLSAGRARRRGPCRCRRVLPIETPDSESTGQIPQHQIKAPNPQSLDAGKEAFRDGQRAPATPGKPPIDGQASPATPSRRAPRIPGLR